jgi:hypothetical protein
MNLRANTSRGTDSWTSRQPLDRWTASQALVTGIERTGDAMTARAPAGTWTAGALLTAVAGTATEAVRAKATRCRAANGVFTAESTKALARCSAGAGTSGKIPVVRAANQPGYA